MPERMQQRVQVSTIRQVSVYLATVTVFMDVFLLIPGFAYYVYQVIGLGPFEYGMISASYSLFRMAGVLVFGWMADKYGRRPPLIIGSIVVAAALFTMTQAWGLIPFVLLNSLRGFFAGGATPSIHALVADISPRKTFGERMSMLALLMNIGPLFGIPFSGILFDIGVTIPFIAAGSMELLTVLIGIFLIPETVQRRKSRKMETQTTDSERPREQQGRPRNIWLDLFTRRGLIVANVYTFSEDFFEKTVGSVVLPYFTYNLGITATWYGMFMGIAAFLRMLVYLPVGTLSDRIGRKLPIQVGLLLKGVPLIAYPAFLLPGLQPLAWWGILILKCLDGAGDAFTGGPERALVMDWTFNRYERGKAQSINEATQALGGTLGKPLTGWLIDITSVVTGFYFGAIGLVGAAIFVQLAWKDPPQLEVTE